MAKTYSCPVCFEEFTTALIKRSDRMCPNCGMPLKHDIDKSSGSMVHRWIQDESRQALKPKETTNSGLKYERISPDDNPEIFRLIGPNPDPKNIPDFQIVYWDKMSQTHLRCPACDQYLHTTGVVVGWQEAFCRTKIPVGNSTGKWKKCQTRTKFIFIRRGGSHEINT